MVALVKRPAPTFKSKAVTNGQFTVVDLADHLGKWVVLFSTSGYLSSEILAFNDTIAKFKDLDTEVFAVSTDSKASLFAWATQPRKEGDPGPSLALPLIANRNMSISRDYGALFEDERIALHGLFIIDPKDILHQITVNDLPVGRSVDETIRLIMAFQFTDKHGEVCPANWSEGGKTIKIDPHAKLEFFEATNDAANGNHSNKRPRTD